MAEDELEKMTATDLRDYALKNHPELTGVHAMKKEELIAAIHKARGEDVKKKAEGKAEINKPELKKKIHELKAEKAKLIEEKNKKALSRLRKKIKRLKRLTKKAA